MNANDLVFVYSTFPDADSARKIASELVNRRLAACVNIHGPMTSVYEWQGKLEDGTEYAVFIKTTRENVDAVSDAARALHPYTVPCFLVLPIENANQDYLDWARGQIG